MSNNFLHTSILSNRLQDYLLVLGVILLVIIIKRLLSRFLASKLLTVLIGHKKHFNKETFLNLVLQPIERFIVAFICITALDRLRFPDEINFSLFGTTFQQILVSFAIIVIIVLIIRLCIRLITFVALILEEKANLTNDVTDSQLIVFFKDFFKVILIIIGGLLILRFAFHRDITQVFTGLSIVGAAMALAAKESLENLIASFIIFFDKPFTTGNTVKVLGITGTVEKIGLRSTRIRTDQKTYITVPNKQMVDTVMDNITQRTQRRADLKIEVSLNATADQLDELTKSIQQILSSYSAIENHSVYLSETGRNANVIDILYFTKIDQSMDEFNTLKHIINLSIIQLIEKMNIKLAANSELNVINK